MEDAFWLFWERVNQRLSDISLIELLAALLATLLVIVFRGSITQLGRLIWSALTSGWDATSRLDRARTAVDESGQGLWLTIKHNPHPSAVLEKLADTRKLILTVANLKGGVGKTTLTANLAAYFANPFNDPNRQCRRVLAIDLDFQGSMSSMMFAGTEWSLNEKQLSPASQLIAGDIRSNYRGQLGQPIANCPPARGISAYYDLARVENREMVRWLIKDCDDDIRYRLARLLLSDVAAPFDMILIDAPPRLTTGCIQALCASTHVLIPTIPDPLAATGPVGYFGAQLKAHECLFPHLKILGVIGTKTHGVSREIEEIAIKGAANRLRDALKGSVGNLGYIETRNETFDFRHDLWLVDSTPLARAAENGIAYVSLGVNAGANGIRKNFDNIGQEVERRWRL